MCSQCTPPPSLSVRLSFTPPPLVTRSAIAAANGIALEALIAANPGVDCGNLQIGQNLCVPSPPLPAGAVVGFWHWTWSASSGSPAGTNLGEIKLTMPPAGSLVCHKLTISIDWHRWYHLFCINANDISINQRRTESLYQPGNMIVDGPACTVQVPSMG